jgi:hypothetical protein
VPTGAPGGLAAGSSANGVHAGSAVVSAFESVSACWMAVTGRQKPTWYFCHQVAMRASATLTLTRAKVRAVVTMLRGCAAAYAISAFPYCTTALAL